MPKLVVYKRDIKTLIQAGYICGTLAYHEPDKPLFGDAADAISDVLHLLQPPPSDDDKADEGADE